MLWSQAVEDEIVLLVDLEVVHLLSQIIHSGKQILNIIYEGHKSNKQDQWGRNNGECGSRLY